MLHIFCLAQDFSAKEKKMVSIIMRRKRSGEYGSYVGRALIQIGGGGAYLPILFFVISTLYFLGGSNNADSVVPLGFVSVLGAGATTSSFQKLPEGPIVLCLSKTSLTCAFLLSTVPSI